MLEGLSLDKSGSFTIKNIGMTTYPMEYDQWEYTPLEELAASCDDWVGKPVYCTEDHPKGTSISDYSDIPACGTIIGAKLQGESIIFTLSLWGLKTLTVVSSGKYFTSSAYLSATMPCDVTFDNSAKVITTEEAFVNIKGRNVGIIPLHLLLTDAPRAGALTLIRNSINMEEQFAKLLAPIISKMDEMSSEMSSMKEGMGKYDKAMEHYNSLSESTEETTEETSEESKEEEATEEKAEETTEAKENKGETIDLEKLASLLSEKLVANSAESPDVTKVPNSLAEHFSNKWSD